MNMTSNHKKMSAYGFFLSISALITFIVLMSSPSESKNAFLLGYSLERILLGAGMLGAVTALLFITFIWVRSPERAQRVWAFAFQQKNTSNKLFAVLVFAFLAIWIFLFLPSYRLGAMASYLSRLFPILIWILLVSFATLLVFFFERRQHGGYTFADEDKGILKVGAIIFGVLFIFAIFVAISGIGTSYPADYWYGAGVPVLGLQVLFSILAGVAFIVLEPRLKFNNTHLDFALFALIWIVAAIFWAPEPLSPNYFMPDTADNPIYPYSDGATFDQGAQYALIGQGLFNGVYFDRTLYTALLAYLHLFLGQDFHLLMTVQAAFFAVLPAVVYLIGKELHSRALGISAGVLIAIRGVNAIVAAKWIDTASPKMLLTDFPTAIGISIFLLILLKWLKQPEKFTGLIWAGAVFGLTLMVRTHALTLLPVVLLLIPFIVKMHWKKAVLAGLLVIVGLFTVTLPWEVRNQSRGIPMFYIYYYRIEIILLHRYGIDIGASILPQDFQNFDNRQSNAFTNRPTRLRNIARESGEDLLCTNKVCSIFNHLVHNVVTSFVSLPSSPVFDDLWNTVKADTPYWKKSWKEGQVGGLGAMMIAFNIALTSFGIGTIWSRSKWRILLPILIFLAYLATNSLGFTSGGRYIAPVDWIIYIFFIAGGLQLVSWIFDLQIPLSSDESRRLEISEFTFSGKSVYPKLFSTLFIILLVGTFLPISDFIARPRYLVRMSDEILEDLETKGLLQQSGYSRDELTSFLAQPTAMIREGRALYPRYYPAGDGEQDRSTYYRYLDFQRLVFTLIGPYSENAEGVVIPGFPPPLSMHAEDVIVIGCWNTTYYSPFLDAVVVFVPSGDEGYVYTRSPGAPLQCPLPEPR